MLGLSIKAKNSESKEQAVRFYRDFLGFEIEKTVYFIKDFSGNLVEIKQK